VRQGCVLSPSLFSLYSEVILRNIEPLKGIKIGEQNINNIRFAGDAVFVAESEEELKEILDVGVEVPQYTTVYTKNTQGDSQARRSLLILGELMTTHEKSDQEIKRRIEMAKTAFQNLKQLLTNRHLLMTTKVRILHCYVWAVLLYGCETWTLNKKMEDRLESCEMWFLDV
jgi:hypothetical protein